MQDTDLFMSLAEIAGVFVGFGALIAVRSGGASEPMEVAPMRGMVSMGLATVVAALAPVTLGRYGLTDHQVWALSSVLLLVGFFGIFGVNARTPEYRANVTTMRGGRFDVIEGAAWLLYMSSLVLVPIIILLGVAPDREAALYFTVVVLFLLGAGWTLLWLVFAQRRTADA